jgi:hypothetical protein
MEINYGQANKNQKMDERKEESIQSQENIRIEIEHVFLCKTFFFSSYKGYRYSRTTKKQCRFRRAKLGHDFLSILKNQDSEFENKERDSTSYFQTLAISTKIVIILRFYKRVFKFGHTRD